MGNKKKPRKTEELSVAKAEASSTPNIDETHQQQAQSQSQSQAQTPRKRGRPRKVVNIVEQEEKQLACDENNRSTVSISQVLAFKKVKTSTIEELNLVKEEGSSTAMEAHDEYYDGDKKEELGQSRRRSRRKSKPRKSS